MMMDGGVARVEGADVTMINNVSPLHTKNQKINFVLVSTPLYTFCQMSFSSFVDKFVFPSDAQSRTERTLSLIVDDVSLMVAEKEYDVHVYICKFDKITY